MKHGSHNDPSCRDNNRCNNLSIGSFEESDRSSTVTLSSQGSSTNISLSSIYQEAFKFSIPNVPEFQQEEMSKDGLVSPSDSTKQREHDAIRSFPKLKKSISEIGEFRVRKNSCPAKQEANHAAQQTRSEDLRQLRRAASIELRSCKTSPMLPHKSPPVASPKAFPKKNIFVTSLTRSRPSSVCSETNEEDFPQRSNSQSKSAPSLSLSLKQHTSPHAKPKKSKSLSEEPPSRRPAWVSGISKCLTDASQKFYRNEHISQLSDFLFIGDIRGGYNEWIMCRLGIASIVDLSNPNKKDLMTFKQMYYPCVCPPNVSHARARLNIAINDTHNEKIDCYFRDINIFIEGARTRNKKVLICSYYGKSRSATVAIQYLMSFNGMTLEQSYGHVKYHRPETDINGGFWLTLAALDRELQQARLQSPKHSKELEVSDVTFRMSDC
ncbi:uncharacterized protein LOC106166385 [Lingula anatina]|uniref:protein-tyrosine-phosphatase n=1 Tax=Lingula anatina TaxID=7574 RepID=A0A1S3IQ81_LINAN|nr:uncharacterized protein LOC106166385 [Lingula anatina]|eukprot:XP_013400380.1 uncharacterized protein LOC106166385 [Lingula anatina]